LSISWFLSPVYENARYNDQDILQSLSLLKDEQALALEIFVLLCDIFRRFLHPMLIYSILTRNAIPICNPTLKWNTTTNTTLLYALNFVILIRLYSVPSQWVWLLPIAFFKERMLKKFIKLSKKYWLLIEAGVIIMVTMTDCNNHIIT
jgi:hypothetical protein